MTRPTAALAAASSRPHHLVRAAHAAAARGREDEALALYGRAIDGYLEGGNARAGTLTW